MRKKTAKKLKLLAQIVTASSPDNMKKVDRRMKKTWNENKPK
jgi:hypothetical protein